MEGQLRKKNLFGLLDERIQHYFNCCGSIVGTVGKKEHFKISLDWVWMESHTGGKETQSVLKLWGRKGRKKHLTGKDSDTKLPSWRELGSAACPLL